MYSIPDLVKILGKVMGIVFQAPGSKIVYVAGNTVWDSYVNQTLAKFHPDVIILNTGDAPLSREELRKYVQQKGIQDRILIPDDGEILKLYPQRPLQFDCAPVILLDLFHEKSVDRYRYSSE
ncbi:hypothetical protein EDD21DRAFT_414670 [Dissophora ornata]|nr:hypothetical protein EDD21DRAFT_414670 [Dissophora ornata]